MSVRKKLNGMYFGGCVVFAVFIGVVSNSWVACALAFGVAAMVQLMTGNIRLARAHHR